MERCILMNYRIGARMQAAARPPGKCGLGFQIGKPQSRYVITSLDSAIFLLLVAVEISSRTRG